MIKDTLLTGSAGIALNTLTTDTLTHTVNTVQQTVQATPITTWTNLGIAVCTLLGIIIQTFFKNRNTNNQNN
jgi:hypothetical protein